MPHKSKVTTDHETIRAWTEERGGVPSRLKIASADPSDLLSIEFDKKDQDREPVRWEKFFDAFEEYRLAFLYQDLTPEGEESRYCKIIFRNDDVLPGTEKKKKKSIGIDGEEVEGGGDDDEDEDDLELEEDEGYDADKEEPDEM